MSYRTDKPNFPKFWVKMAKMTLKVKVNGLRFQYQPRVSHDACLVILAQIYDELTRGQAEPPRILSQNDQDGLEGQGQWSLFSIPAESIPWCMFGANLVIPTEICDELSCGQGKVYGRTDGRTDGRTADGQTQATTIPLRLERSRGETFKNVSPYYKCLYILGLLLISLSKYFNAFNLPNVRGTKYFTFPYSISI